MPPINPPENVVVAEREIPPKQQATIELLKEEYLLLHKTINDFDQKALTIKAWSVTASLAAIAAAFSVKTSGGVSPDLCLLASIGSLSFWVTETLWKLFQQCYYGRIEKIESLFRNSTEPDAAPFQIGFEFSNLLRKRKTSRHFFHIMFLPHVMFPHVIVITVGVIAWQFYNR